MRTAWRDAGAGPFRGLQNEKPKSIPPQILPTMCAKSETASNLFALHPEVHVAAAAVLEQACTLTLGFCDSAHVTDRVL